MYKEKKCERCGKPHNRRGKYCSYECGAEAWIEAAEQIRKKEGPIYDKWKSRLKAAIGSL